MLRTVKLHGELAEFVGHKELKAVINNTADAIKFLVSNFPKLESYMAHKYYQIIVDDYDIGEDDIHNPIGRADINIIPIITGEGGGRTGNRILLGAALIGASFLFPGAGMFGHTSLFQAEAGKGLLTGLGTVISGIGANLVLSGVNEMLFPLPKPEEHSNDQDPRISFSFSGIQNTSRAGTSHPIVYGEVIVGSVVISANVDTNQVVA
tara:strand:- start:11629 stop:12252 length:624 start_codon:yes stop_codon:yes gene_type:complete